MLSWGGHCNVSFQMRNRSPSYIHLQEFLVAVWGCVSLPGTIKLERHEVMGRTDSVPIIGGGIIFSAAVIPRPNHHGRRAPDRT